MGYHSQLNIAQLLPLFAQVTLILILHLTVVGYVDKNMYPEAIDET